MIASCFLCLHGEYTWEEIPFFAFSTAVSFLLDTHDGSYSALEHAVYKHVNDNYLIVERYALPLP